MKNTVRLIIKNIILIVLPVALFCQCSNVNDGKKDTTVKKSVQKKHKNKVTKKRKKKKAKLVTLTDDNVVQELTKYGNANKESLLLLKTSMGNMKIKLYENTPLHRANIIRLIKNDFYKGTVFYRVINDFMIQGGDAEGWERQSIKAKMGYYTIPAEFRAENIHKKGAVSMAREYEDNPDKRSVSFEFFIVQGTTYTEGELLGTEREYGITINPAHRDIYKKQGGCPHLNGQHTVFGQVIEGLDVIDKIASVKVDNSNWPIEDVTIDFEILE